MKKYDPLLEIENRDLMRGFHEGHKRAFDKVFEIFYSELYVFGMKLIRDEDISKDIVIDVMTSLFKLHKRFDSVQHVRSFLYVSIKNACFNHLKYTKRRKQREPGLIRFMNQNNECTNDEIDGAFLKRIYTSSLESLPLQTRKVIELIYDDSLTYPQVAIQLNISVNTVKGLRKYGLKKIKDSIIKRNMAILMNEWFNKKRAKLIN